MQYALLQNLRFEFSCQSLSQRPKYLLQSVGLLFTLLRTLIPMLEHKTVLSFQVTRNGNQTGNRLRFLSLLLYYLWFQVPVFLFAVFLVVSSKSNRLQCLQ